MTQNTTDNEPGEALKPCPLAHFVVNGIRFTDFSNEYKSHIWCYDCGLQFEGRANESRGSVAWRWNSRAPLAAVGGGFTCSCCGRNMELRVDGKFCNECATTIKPLLRAMDGALEYLESDPTLIEVSAPLRRAFAAAASSAPAEPPQHAVCKCGHVRDLHYKQFGPCSGKECSGCAKFVEAPAEPEGEQEREVQCADCQAWFSPNANHTCRQQVRRNQRSAK